MIEDHEEMHEKEMKQEDEKQSEYMKNYKKQKRKWKKVNSDFGMMSAKFLATALLIEIFFLYSYFISKQFLD